MPEPLTELERHVLEYLVQYLRSNTYQPSIREIGREFSIKSTKTVSELLQSLADKGWIERDPSRSRGVRLLGLQLQNPDGVSLPIYAEPEHHPTGGLVLDRRFGGTGSYIVTMPDATLADIGIEAGDLLLVEPSSVAELQEGDVVCARAHGALVVRRVRLSPAGAMLESAASAAAAPVPLNAVSLQGRAGWLIRQLRVAAAADAPVSITA